MNTIYYSLLGFFTVVSLSLSGSDLHSPGRHSPRQFISSYGSFQAQGSRDYQEDRCDFFEDRKKDTTALAIYDGHAGSIISDLLAEGINKNKKLTSVLCKKLSSKELDKKAVYEKIKTAFTKFDEKINTHVIKQANNGYTDNLCCGSAAIMTVILDQAVYLATTGNSRILVIFKDDSFCTTKTHTLLDTAEKQRIIQAGGNTYQNKIHGVLHISRSFGDIMPLGHPHDHDSGMKKPAGLIADPDIYTFQRNEVKVIVLGSNGLWNALDQNRVAKNVSRWVDQNVTSKKIARNLCQLTNRHDKRDNMSVMIATLDQ
jgi:serine/threonine protein phosphatase PrpC